MDLRDLRSVDHLAHAQLEEGMESCWNQWFIGPYGPAHVLRSELEPQCLLDIHSASPTEENTLTGEKPSDSIVHLILDAFSEVSTTDPCNNVL